MLARIQCRRSMQRTCLISQSAIRQLSGGIGGRRWGGGGIWWNQRRLQLPRFLRRKPRTLSQTIGFEVCQQQWLILRRFQDVVQAIKVMFLSPHSHTHP